MDKKIKSDKSILKLSTRILLKMKKILSIRLLLIIIFITKGCLVFSQSQLTNLPSIYINTTNSQPITDKTTWVPGNIVVLSTDTSEVLNATTEIRGRGNSTWEFEKKPYRIRLTVKDKLIDMPAKARNWVLLANHADKSLIRNAVAFKIGKILDFEYTPACRFADFTLNNQYLGNYLVTDQIEVGGDRVDIDKLDTLDFTEPNLSGGYLLEIDGFASGEPVWFTTEKGLKITVKSPDDDKINQAQLEYIKNYITDFENRLFSTNFKDTTLGYRERVDTTSLINWYIASELTGNSDAFWSTYVYKKRNDNKLYFGPMWDYDIAFNNDNRLGDATEKLMSQHAHDPKTWIQQLLLDEWFQAAVWRKWQEIVANNIAGTLNTYINKTDSLIDLSQQKNFTKWNVLNSQVYREQYLFSTYGEGVDYLKTYLSNRIAFLNSSLKYIEPPKPSEPFVPANYSYMVMNKKTNNLIDVTNNSVLVNAKLVMWEPINEDNSQLWEIKQLNDSLFRFVNKNSGLAMAGVGKGANLIQVAVNNNDNTQKWKIKPVGVGNIYGIVNQKSGYSVDNSGGSFANGTNVIEYTNNIAENENQQWYIQKVNLIGTGINSNQADFVQLEIYPNPATDIFSIRFGVAEPQEFRITINNIAGQQVYTDVQNFDLGKQVKTISINNLEAGLYFVNITDKQGRVTFKKLIIK